MRLLMFVLSMVFIFGGCSILAQTATLPGEDHQFADLNGDGYLDVVSSAQNGETFLIHLASEAGQYTTTQGSISTNYVACSAMRLYDEFILIDANGDGLKDLVIEDYLGFVSYTNDGTGDFSSNLGGAVGVVTEEPGASESYIYLGETSGFGAHDVNGDGIEDLTLFKFISFPDSVVDYMAYGFHEFKAYTYDLSEGLNYPDVLSETVISVGTDMLWYCGSTIYDNTITWTKAADLDADGTEELLFRLKSPTGIDNDPSHVVRSLETTGSSSAYLEEIASPDFVDMNDDDRADLFFANGHFRINQGDGTFSSTISQNQHLAVSGDNVYRPFDYGEDGDIDFLGRVSGALTLIENIGEGQYSLMELWPGYPSHGISAVWTNEADDEWYLLSGTDVFSFQYSGLEGDINGDGLVDIADFIELNSQWGECGDCTADLDDDGDVDVDDFLVLNSAFQ